MGFARAVSLGLLLGMSFAGCRTLGDAPPTSAEAKTEYPGMEQVRQVLASVKHHRVDDEAQILLDLADALPEAGPDAIPMVIQAALSKKYSGYSMEMLSAVALAGGETGRDALDLAVGDVKPRYTDISRACLFKAMARTGRDSDIDALINVLSQASRSDISNSEAAYMLGILRVEKARPSLEALVRKGDNYYGYSEAKDALEWLDAGSYELQGWDETSEQNRVIAAVLRHGVPHTDRSNLFYLEDAPYRLDKDGTVWRVIASSDPRPYFPSMRFSVRVSTAGTYAVADVCILYGILDGTTDRFLLTKSDGLWCVSSVENLMIH